LSSALRSPAAHGLLHPSPTRRSSDLVVFEAAGHSLAEIVAAGDRGVAVTAAAAGAEQLARRWYSQGLVSGVLAVGGSAGTTIGRSEEHTSELQSRENLVCRLLLEKKK